MIFQQILLQIFHKFERERSISATYHLLKGKRSGQTIQDVGLFKLHVYFGLLPKLSRKLFDQEVSKLVSAQFLTVQEDGHFILQPSARVTPQFEQPLFFDSWHYRGNEHVFFNRLSLIVQTLSHQKEGNMSFSPVIKDEAIQRWVRHFLLAQHYQTVNLQQPLVDEISNSLKELGIEDEHLVIILNRLSGHGVPGHTWEQLAFIQQEEPLDVQLRFISILHQWLNHLYQSNQYPLLQSLAHGIRMEAILTSSAMQTAVYFREGYSVDQIGFMRKLKNSTIEDHLVELAMNEPNFPFDRFVSEQDVQEIRQMVVTLQTKKLKKLHAALERFTYFQLRLVLAKGEL